MVITRTPYRISFFGGGTDYPAWYREHGGAVLATTINKYCYISCRFLPPFFEHRMRVVYSKIESCDSVHEIQHPAVRAILRYLEIDRGVAINHDGDLPARSGMGSSSAFTVGLLNALHALQGKFVSKKQLALEGIELEQRILKETVGSQDQVLAAHGGFNHVIFHSSDEISVRPVILAPDRKQQLNEHLMLFFTGINRTASSVAERYLDSLEKKRTQLRLLKEMVDEALSVLSTGKSLAAFGELLHEAWLVKRSLGGMISSEDIDQIYESARSAGALGGKLTGAGGGGFLLLFVPPENQSKVKEALRQLLYVPFGFESAGSQVIHYEHEEDFSGLDSARANGQPIRFREMVVEAKQ